MDENRDLLLKSITETYHKEITDEALDYLEGFVNFKENEFKNYDDKIQFIDMLTYFANEVSEDANSDVIIKEDVDIMLKFPNGDMIFPFTPIKNLIDNSTSKNINKDAAKELTSTLEDYCKDILQRANNIATQRGHEKIMEEDIEEAI